MIIISMGLFLNAACADWVEVGSRDLTADYILQEIVALTIENSAGIEVRRKPGLGNAQAFHALTSKRIDLYVDYSGAIAEIILKTDLKTTDEINLALTDKKIRLSNPLGFKLSNSANYEGVVVIREDLISRKPKVWAALKTLEGRLTDKRLQELVFMVDVEKKSYSEAAKSFVENQTKPKKFILAIIAISVIACVLLVRHVWKRNMSISAPHK